MGETSAVAWKLIDKLRGKKWVAAVLEARLPLAEQVIQSQAAFDAAKKALAEDKKRLQEFDDMLRPRAKRRRRLLRRFGERIGTPDGEFTLISRGKVLDIDPAKSEGLIDELEQSKFADKTVKVTKEVRREPLKQLPRRYLRRLRAFGVTVGQMHYVSIKSAGETDATNLVKERRGEG